MSSAPFAFWLRARIVWALRRFHSRKFINSDCLLVRVFLIASEWKPCAVLHTHRCEFCRSQNLVTLASVITLASFVTSHYVAVTRIVYFKLHPLVYARSCLHALSRLVHRIVWYYKVFAHIPKLISDSEIPSVEIHRLFALKYFASIVACCEIVHLHFLIDPTLLTSSVLHRVHLSLQWAVAFVNSTDKSHIVVDLHFYFYHLRLNQHHAHWNEMITPKPIKLLQTPWKQPSHLLLYVNIIGEENHKTSCFPDFPQIFRFSSFCDIPSTSCLPTPYGTSAIMPLEIFRE